MKNRWARFALLVLPYWPFLFLFSWSLFFFRDLIFGHKIFLDADIATQYYPWYAFTAEKIRAWQLPLWSADMGSGYPLFAEGETGALYPLLRILYVLFPTAIAFTFVYPIHFFLLSIFTYLHLRSLRVSKFAAIFGAYAYSYGLFFVTKIIQPSILMSATWFPLGMWAVHEGINKDKRYLLILPVIVFLHVVAGHPQVVFICLLAYILYASALIILVTSRKNRFLRLKRLGVLLIALFIGLLLSSIQTLPLVELGKQSLRPTENLHYLFSHSFPFSHLVTAFYPNYFGRVTPDTTNPPPWYGGSYWEFSFYIGLLPTLFAFWSLKFFKKNRYIPIFATLTLIFFLLSFGGYLWPYRALVRSLANFGLFPFRVSARFLLVGSYALAVLGAIGVEQFFVRVAKGTLLNNISNYLGLRPFVARTCYLSERPKNKTSSFVFMFKGVVLCLLLFDLYLYGYSYNRKYDQQLLSSKPTILTFLPSDTRQQYRLFSPSEWLPFPEVKRRLLPNINLLWHVPTVTATTPLPLPLSESTMFPSQYETALSRMNAGFILTPKRYQQFFLMGEENGMFLYALKDPLPRTYLTDMIVATTSREKALEYFTNPTWPSTAVAVEEKVPLVKKTLSLETSVQLIQEDDVSKTILAHTNKDALLTYVDRIYPGWEVFVDGKKEELLRINGIFKGVLVKEGEHRVQFAFRPQSVKLGFWMSIIGAVMYILFTLFLLSKNEQN